MPGARIEAEIRGAGEGGGAVLGASDGRVGGTIRLRRDET